MKVYSHDNWNQVLALPDGPKKDGELKIVGMLAKGNLFWFVRRLVGGTPTWDKPEWVEKWVAAGEMLPSPRHKERYAHLIGEDK